MTLLVCRTIKPTMVNSRRLFPFRGGRLFVVVVDKLSYDKEIYKL